ncbi:hypothetical protein C8Q74DRAFT_1366634 [Fomes fomentarius]|nr:hypothetical protein C8Q74DRAFT_1366634 [Fomes fomentarius]
MPPFKNVFYAATETSDASFSDDALSAEHPSVLAGPSRKRTASEQAPTSILKGSSFYDHNTAHTVHLINAFGVKCKTYTATWNGKRYEVAPTPYERSTPLGLPQAGWDWHIDTEEGALQLRRMLWSVLEQTPVSKRAKLDISEDDAMESFKSCLSLEEYEKVKKEHTKLNKKYTELKKQYTELKKEHTKLKVMEQAKSQGKAKVAWAA